MNKHHIKGTVGRIKGAVKESTGKAIGNRKMQAKGKLDKAKGKLERVVGDVKDKVRRATG